MPCSSQSPHAGQVRVGRDEHAVGADDRLEDDGRDLLDALVLDDLGEVRERALALLLRRGGAEGRPVQVRPHEVDDPRDARLAPPAPRLAGEGDRPGGGAVVAAVGGEDLVPAGVGRPADGVLGGLGPAVREEHRSMPSGVGGDQPGSLVAGLVGERRRHVHSRWACSTIASMIRGCWCPRLRFTSPELKSSHRLPSWSQNSRAGTARQRQRADQVLRRPGVEDMGAISRGHLGVGGGDRFEAGHRPIMRSPRREEGAQARRSIAAGRTP